MNLIKSLDSPIENIVMFKAFRPKSMLKKLAKISIIGFVFKPYRSRVVNVFGKLGWKITVTEVFA